MSLLEQVAPYQWLRAVRWVVRCPWPLVVLCKCYITTVSVRLVCNQGNHSVVLCFVVHKYRMCSQWQVLETKNAVDWKNFEIFSSTQLKKQNPKYFQCHCISTLMLTLHLISNGCIPLFFVDMAPSHAQLFPEGLLWHLSSHVFLMPGSYEFFVGVLKWRKLILPRNIFTDENFLIYDDSD